MSRSRKQRKPRRQSHTRVEGLPRWARSNERVKMQFIGEPGTQEAILAAKTPSQRAAIKRACTFWSKGNHDKVSLPHGMTKKEA